MTSQSGQTVTQKQHRIKGLCVRETCTCLCLTLPGTVSKRLSCQHHSLCLRTSVLSSKYSYLFNKYQAILTICQLENSALLQLGHSIGPQIYLPRAKSGTSQVALVVKNPNANAGDIRDAGSIPGSGRSPGEGHDNPLQYSCLENHSHMQGTEKSRYFFKVVLKLVDPCLYYQLDSSRFNLQQMKLSM